MIYQISLISKWKRPSLLWRASLLPISDLGLKRDEHENRLLHRDLQASDGPEGLILQITAMIINIAGK